MYSVEPVYEDDGHVRSRNMVHIEAESPRQAAETVLGEPVSMAGASELLRCRVWWLDGQFRTVSVSLYAVDASQDPAGS